MENGQKYLYASHFGKGYRLLPTYHFQCTGPLKPDLKSWIFWKVYYWTVNLYYCCYFFQYLKGMVSTAQISASGMVNLYFWILAGEGHKHRFLFSAKKRFSHCGTTVQFLHLLLNHSHPTLLSSILLQLTHFFLLLSETRYVRTLPTTRDDIINRAFLSGLNLFKVAQV